MSKLLFIGLLFTSTLLQGQIQTSLIDSIINSKIGEEDPGLSVGIVQDGKIIYEKYWGLANLQHSVPVDKKTRSNIASTAKQFTALMILDLSQKGKLSLEDDVRNYLPNLYPNVEEKIKIRHIINHTSGIRDYVELMSLQNRIWWKQAGLDNDDVMTLLRKQENLAFPPGSKYTYSNGGYIVLSQIIAEVSGEDFNNYSKKFFSSLGMQNTNFAEKYMRVIPHRADPYADWGGGEWYQSPTITRTSGEGFLFTTLTDMLIYEIALQSASKEGNMLLVNSQKSIPNSEIKGYGFGLELGDKKGRKAIHHSGATYGYQSQVVRYPEENLSFFLMSNNGNIRTDRIADELADLFLVKVEEKINYDQALVTSSQSIDKLSILGQYTSIDGEKFVEIKNDQGNIYWNENNYKLLMNLETEKYFAFEYDPSLRVAFQGEKMIEYYASGKTETYKRSSIKQASFEDLDGLVGKYASSELDIDFELTLDEQGILQMSFSNGLNSRPVKMLNRNRGKAGNQLIKVNRDKFDRCTSILLSLGRAKNILFKKKSNLKCQNRVKTENGSIQVTTIGSPRNDASDILLTKNYENGNEIWSKRFGGSSWDKASSILDTGDGYLIVGSTSSYGEGNYDVFVIKTDKNGKKMWQNTYGEFYNEYGYAAEKTANGYIIKGSIQKCTSNSDVLNRTCVNNVWFVTIDNEGKEISREVLEPIVQ